MKLMIIGVLGVLLTTACGDSKETLNKDIAADKPHKEPVSIYNTWNYQKGDASFQNSTITITKKNHMIISMPGGYRDSGRVEMDTSKIRFYPVSWGTKAKFAYEYQIQGNQLTLNRKGSDQSMAFQLKPKK